MARGVFTQSTTVLFEKAPSIDEIALVLAAWKPARAKNAKQSWVAGRDQLVIRFDEKQNGTVAVDVIDAPWPDSMGDPKGDADLFGAWVLGAFGPLVFPGGLARAVQQAVVFPGAKEQVAKHRAFVRLRTSYVMGAGPDAKVLPSDWQTLAEIETLLAIAHRVLTVPRAIALFDPNGEVVLPREEVDASLEHAREKKIPPLDLITHVRLFKLPGDQGLLMDTVGMERFMLRDAEIILAGDLDPNDGAAFLRNISLHHLRRGSVIPAGNTTDGPDGRYRATLLDQGAAPPPRAVVRFARG
jgi:hypothetical protein